MAKIRKLQPNLSPDEASRVIHQLRRQIMNAEFEMLRELYGGKKLPAKESAALQAQIKEWNKEVKRLTQSLM